MNTFLYKVYTVYVKVEQGSLLRKHKTFLIILFFLNTEFWKLSWSNFLWELAVNEIIFGNWKGEKNTMMSYT